MRAMLLLACAAAVVVSCTASPAPLRRAAEREGDDDDTGEEKERTPDDATHAAHQAETPEPDDGSKPSTGADVFGGAPAYASGSPPHSANDHHTSSNTGKDCFSCHGDHAPALKLGGTVYRGTKPAPNVQVRVLDEDGQVQATTYSDSDGNFWVTGTPLTPGKTGFRTATTKKSMTARITNGSCNAASCHGPNNRLTVP